MNENNFAMYCDDNYKQCEIYSQQKKLIGELEKQNEDLKNSLIHYESNTYILELEKQNSDLKKEFCMMCLSYVNSSVDNCNKCDKKSFLEDK